jgi:hypothetical protein
MAHTVANVAQQPLGVKATRDLGHGQADQLGTGEVGQSISRRPPLTHYGLLPLRRQSRINDLGANSVLG